MTYRLGASHLIGNELMSPCINLLNGETVLAGKLDGILVDLASVRDCIFDDGSNFGVNPLEEFRILATRQETCEQIFELGHDFEVKVLG